MTSQNDNSGRNLNGNNILSRNTSLTSLGIGIDLGSLEDVAKNPLIKQKPLSRHSERAYKKYLYDSAAFVIKCVHNNMAICKVENGNGFWLPWVELSSGQKWESANKKIIQLIVRDEKQLNTMVIDKHEEHTLDDVKLTCITRLALPQGGFVIRNIYFAKWINQNSCCKSTYRIMWVPINQVKYVERLWGSEVITFSVQAEEYFNGKKVKVTVIEKTSKEVLKYTVQDNKTIDLSTFTGLYTDMLHKALIRKKEIITIYIEFTQHCYPSLDMSFTSFCEYMIKINYILQEQLLKGIFRAFNYKVIGYLEFAEFLLGLGAFDQAAMHNEARLPYVFRFYDVDSDGYLNYNEFFEMVKDIRKNSNKSIDLESVASDVDQRLKYFSLTDIKIDYLIFQSLVTNLKLRGTSYLFRSQSSFIKKILLHSAYGSIYSFVVDVPYDMKNITGVCPKHKRKNYQIAFHIAKLNYQQGRFVDSKSLLQIAGRDIDFKPEDDLTELLRKHSLESVFNFKSAPNANLQIIRSFASENLISTSNQSFKTPLTLTAMTYLCKQAKEIFINEARCLKINSPCFVVGDLHGNLNNLMTYELQLWRLLPAAQSANILFLGNLVDGEKFGVETVAYLFCLKILMPEKVFIIRGNNEVRSVQMSSTFYKECIDKFQEQIGKQVFELVNSAFDCLPVCGLIDETVFCCHGGIPKSLTKISELNKIQVPLFDPENEAPAVWEMVWSDPIELDEFLEIRQNKNLSDDIFIPNYKRKIGYFFSEQALNIFLKENQLTHVIRGHQVEHIGYKLNLNGKVITVFSCSQFNGLVNTSACLLVDSTGNDGYIIVIRLET